MNFPNFPCVASFDFQKFFAVFCRIGPQLIGQLSYIKQEVEVRNNFLLNRLGCLV